MPVEWPTAGQPAREILGDWRDTRVRGQGQPRLRSELEARLLAMIATHGMPPPVCNETLEVDGERLEVDLLWPRQRLVVEADGRNQIDREPRATVAAIRRLLEQQH